MLYNLKKHTREKCLALLFAQFYIFIEIEAHKLDRAYIEGSDVFGGPGNTEVVTTPVFRLP